MKLIQVVKYRPRECKRIRGSTRALALARTFAGPGGREARQMGQACATPWLRSPSTQRRWNAWAHGSITCREREAAGNIINMHGTREPETQ